MKSSLQRFAGDSAPTRVRRRISAQRKKAHSIGRKIRAGAGAALQSPFDGQCSKVTSSSGGAPVRHSATHLLPLAPWRASNTCATRHEKRASSSAEHCRNSSPKTPCQVPSFMANALFFLDTGSIATSKIREIAPSLKIHSDCVTLTVRAHHGEPNADRNASRPVRVDAPLAGARSYVTFVRGDFFSTLEADFSLVRRSIAL